MIEYPPISLMKEKGIGSPNSQAGGSFLDSNVKELEVWIQYLVDPSILDMVNFSIPLVSRTYGKSTSQLDFTGFKGASH